MQEIDLEFSVDLVWMERCGQLWLSRIAREGIDLCNGDYLTLAGQIQDEIQEIEQVVARVVPFGPMAPRPATPIMWTPWR